jgi:Tfp pilus assembly protein PilN
MNIDINLIPEELRIKPMIDSKTLVAIGVVLLLLFGSVYFFIAKSDSQAQITNLQSQIKTTQQQTAALSSNPEAVQLISSINQLKASNQGYDAFTGARVMMGDALDRVYSLVPTGVNIVSITQKGNTLVIAGSASSYTDAANYGRALDRDPRFTLMGLPSFKGGSFSLTITVAKGGGR